MKKSLKRQVMAALAATAVLGAVGGVSDAAKLNGQETTDAQGTITD